MATMDVDRLIDWCRARGFGIDVDFRSDRVKITTKSATTYRSVAQALEWANGFARNWGVPAP